MKNKNVHKKSKKVMDCVISAISDGGLAVVEAFRKPGTKEVRNQPEREVHKSYENLLKEQYGRLRNLLQESINTEKNKEELSEFQIQFRECFAAWKEVVCLRKEEEQANIILGGYYADEKIRSIFQDFNEYIAEELSEEESSESIVISGYNSCMNFARIDYKKMQERLDSAAEDSAAEDNAARSDGELLIDFLQMLAYKNNFFSELYSGYTVGLKRKNNESVKETDEEIYKLVKKINDSIAKYNESEDNTGFNDIIEDMRSQKNKIIAAVTEAKGLISALAEIMSDENMKLLKNKAADTELLKKQYAEVGELVKDILEQYKR